VSGDIRSLISSKVHKVLFIAISLIVSFLVASSLIIVNDKLFIEEKQKALIEERLHDSEVQGLSDSEIESLFKKINLDIKLPWYSYVFFIGFYFLYWFLLGRIFQSKFPGESILLILSIPTIICIIMGDLFLPLYALACYVGVKKI
jgi:hypothetical protein